MSISLSYAPFARPLLRAFTYGNRSVTERKGFMLRKTSTAGTFFSEASPLPGHSIDNLAEVEEALDSLSANGQGQECPPSVRFALEGLTAQENPGKYPVTTNALLRWANLAEARAQMSQFARAGYSHCKLKVTADGWERQIDLIEEFPSFIFRLDANLSLSAPILEKMVNTLLKRSLLKRVDYLEEPFAEVWQTEFFRGSPIALAADESAPGMEAALRLFENINPPSVFVVKPTVAGGLFSLEPFLETLSIAKKRFLFSSALEAEPGRRSILAFLSRAPTEVCGLSTGYLYRDNFLGDQASWSTIPAPSAVELRYLESLAWKHVP